MQLGLIGNGLSRSRARFLHEFLGEREGLGVVYTPIDLAGRDEVNVADELRRCADAGYAGVNVTHPYKIRAFETLQEFRDLPAGLDSVNTVLFNGPRPCGANTDHSGFMRAFRRAFPLDGSRAAARDVRRQGRYW